ncbi:hypothetical protein JW964_10760 [candidate division KSB1 bacterium]|nr:hypothetical protein [candidate division KSB1 bacterium]
MNSLTKAITLEKSILDELDLVAREMKISSDDLCKLAIKEFLKYHRKNLEIFNQLNSAYADQPDQEEETLLFAMRKRQREIVEGQW